MATRPLAAAPLGGRAFAIRSASVAGRPLADCVSHLPVRSSWFDTESARRLIDSRHRARRYPRPLTTPCAADGNDREGELFIIYGLLPNIGTCREQSTKIPQNAGNVARTAAATGVNLHLVRPLGFDIDDKKLRRAGLDYWPYVVVKVHDSWEDFHQHFLDLPDPKRLFAFSKFGTSHYAAADTYSPGDWLMFGSEIDGLPPEAHQAASSSGGNVVKIPMSQKCKITIDSLPARRQSIPLTATGASQGQRDCLALATMYLDRDPVADVSRRFKKDDPNGDCWGQFVSIISLIPLAMFLLRTTSSEIQGTYTLQGAV